MPNRPQAIRELFEQARRPTSKYDTYYDAYDELLSPFRERNIVLVEVGVQGGGSLEVWRNYLDSGSRIIGVDLNPVIKEELENDGFEIYIGDQQNDSFWRKLYKEVGMVDIIIDDGGHTNKQTAATVRNAVENINDGGLIIIEDAHTSYMKKFGNPSKSSIVEQTKVFVDLVNGRSGRVGPTVSDPLGISEVVHSVQYFESIIAIKIDRRLCRKSKRTFHGSESALSTGRLPDDYRVHSRMRSRVKRWLRGD